MSLWRKRVTSDTVATDVHHNEQKPDHLVNIVTNLSIKSDDLSIKQSKEIEMSKEALKLALEWIEKQPEETPDSKYDVDTRYVVIREIEAALAQPEQDNAYIYASNLAKTIWQKHYIKESPKFALLDTTEGVLTQIDNMTCGLVREKPAQPEQEPVAWEQFHEHMAGTFYKAPPQRTWVGLTMQDAKVIEDNAPSIQMAIFMTEATLKEKNHDMG